MTESRSSMSAGTGRPRLLLFGVFAAGVVGAFFSGLLIAHHQDPTLGRSMLIRGLCGGEGAGCDTVNRSAASEILGVPLAQLGFIFYGLLIVLTMATFISPAPSRVAGRRPIALVGVVYLAAFGAAVDVVLFLYSWIGLGALCNLCLITYGATLAALLLAFLALRRFGADPGGAVANTDAEDAMGLPRWVTARLAPLAVLAGLLAVVLGSDVIASRTDVRRGAVDALLADPEQALSIAWRAFYRHYQAVEPVEIDLDDAPLRGSTRPILSMTLFADFRCPYCRRATEFLGEFTDRNRDAVQLAFKHYPLDDECNCMSDSIHVGACLLARAAIVAQEDGRFWAMHDLLYAAQEIWRNGVSPKQLVSLANRLDLDPETFEARLESEEVTARLQRDIDQANALNVTGTPRLYINGKLMTTLPMEEFLEELLIRERDEKQPFRPSANGFVSR